MGTIGIALYDGSQWVYPQYAGAGVSPLPLRRDAIDWPFATSAWVNMPIASTATYENAGDTRTANLLSTSGSRTINQSSWSVQMVKGQDTDPSVVIRHESGSPTYETAFRVPAGISFPAPDYPNQRDGLTALISSNGRTGRDVYKARWYIQDVEIRGTVSYAIDYQGDGRSGIRASGVSPAAGLLMPWEIDEVNSGNLAYFQHALGMSVNGDVLKSAAATSADGEVVNSVVWPAKWRDSYTGDYTGQNHFGMLYAIPQGIDITTLVSGNLAQGLARTLQNYGVYLVDRSSTSALSAHMSANATHVATLKTAWQTLFPQLRRITNSTSTTPGGGAYPAAPRLASYAPEFGA